MSEMEHVQVLVKQLGLAEDDSTNCRTTGNDPADILQELAQALSGPEANEVLHTFTSFHGHSAVLSLLQAYPQQASAVLLAAAGTAAASAAATAAAALPCRSDEPCLEGSHAPCQHGETIWPLPVIRQLAAHATSWDADHAFATRCMRLLLPAAHSITAPSSMDALSRLLTGIAHIVGHMASSNQGHKEQPAGRSPEWHEYALAAAELLHTICAESSGCSAVIQAAAKSKLDLATDVLLPMYSSLHDLPGAKTGNGNSQDLQPAAAAVASERDQGQQPQQRPCCRAAHLLVSCMHKLLAVGTESVSSMTSPQCPPSSTLPHQNGNSQPLISSWAIQWVLREVQALVTASPPRTQPEHNWAGEVTSFKPGRAARDPCAGHSTSTPAGMQRGTRGSRATSSSGTDRNSGSCGHSSGQNTSAGMVSPGHPDQSLLHRWVLVVGAAAVTGGKAASKGLAAAGAVQLLGQVCDQFRRDFPLVQACEAALAQMVLSHKGVMDELMSDKNGAHGLIGLVSAQLSSKHLTATEPDSGAMWPPPHSCARRQRRLHDLALAALGQLQGLVDTCPGGIFLHMVHVRGLISEVQTQLWSQLAVAALSQACVTADGNPPSCDNSQSSSSGSSAAMSSGAAASSGSGLPQAAGVLLRAHCALYLSCVERARRMGGLQPGAAPRTGCFATLRPHQLQALESMAAQHLRGGPSDQGAASVAGQPAAAAAASANPKKSTPQRQEQPTFTGGAPKGRAAGLEATAGAESDSGSGYDSDGVRTKWNSGPAPQVHAARTAWLASDLGQRMSWDQVSDAVHVRLTLPPGVRKCDVSVDVEPDRLAVSLSWAGRVLDGPLWKRVKAGEILWVLERGSSRPSAAGSSGSSIRSASHPSGGSSNGNSGSDSDVLSIVLPKAEAGRYWKALFEGGPERSHMELLREAVEADERITPYDDLDEGARSLVEDVMEKQWQVANGHFDLENSFDDFRLVLGDNML